MSRVRILFMGTPDFARQALESLLSDEHFEIVGVVTQPDRPAGRKMQLTPSPVKSLALERGLKVFTPEKVNTLEFRTEIAALRAESAVVVAFGQILGDAFLALFPQKAVNVHGSLLPKWRGAAPIQRALMAGDRETGVALQVIVKKLDAGPVLGVRKIALPVEMTAREVYPMLARLGCELLHVEYMDYLRGNLTPHEQDESQVTIAPKIDTQESAIDWSRSALEIQNLVRGLALGPVPHARRESGALFKVCAALAIGAEPAAKQVGAIVGADDRGLDVQCGQGVLRITVLQPESRAKMSVADYVRGYPVSIGERLQNGSKQ